MKKNRSEKNKSNVSISKNPYCIALENAGERTQGKHGSATEWRQRTTPWDGDPCSNNY